MNMDNLVVSSGLQNRNWNMVHDPRGGTKNEPGVLPLSQALAGAF